MDLILQTPTTPTLLKATECLKVLASHSLGRTAISHSIQNKKLNKSLTHTNPAVRLNAYQILQMCCVSGFAVDQVMHADLFLVLVKKARIEVPENQVYLFF